MSDERFINKINPSKIFPDGQSNFPRRRPEVVLAQIRGYMGAPLAAMVPVGQDVTGWLLTSSGRTYAIARSRQIAAQIAKAEGLDPMSQAVLDRADEYLKAAAGALVTYRQQAGLTRQADPRDFSRQTFIPKLSGDQTCFHFDSSGTLRPLMDDDLRLPAIPASRPLIVGHPLETCSHVAARRALDELGLTYTQPNLVTTLTPGHSAIRDLTGAAETYLLPPKPPQTPSDTPRV